MSSMSECCVFPLDGSASQEMLCRELSTQKEKGGAHVAGAPRIGALYKHLLNEKWVFLQSLVFHTKRKLLIKSQQKTKGGRVSFWSNNSFTSKLIWVKSHLKVSLLADDKGFKMPFYGQFIVRGLIPAFPPVSLEISSDPKSAFCEIFPRRLRAGAERTLSPWTFSLASNWQSTCTHMIQRDKLLEHMFEMLKITEWESQIPPNKEALQQQKHMWFQQNIFFQLVLLICSPCD